MNDDKGCSPCAVGEERYEKYSTYLRRKRITRCQYDYRAPDGQLFSCVAPNLEACRARRDAWLKARKD